VRGILRRQRSRINRRGLRGGEGISASPSSSHIDAIEMVLGARVGRARLREGRRGEEKVEREEEEEEEQERERKEGGEAPSHFSLSQVSIENRNDPTLVRERGGGGGGEVIMNGRILGQFWKDSRSSRTNHPDPLQSPHYGAETAESGLLQSLVLPTRMCVSDY